ncbi:MAG: hypothetical protein ACTSUT_14325, partial [Promethearchaeota archaeon]
WKGVRSSVRKRFLGSRVATAIQGELMKAGYKRCKIVAIEQGDEVEEFLNVFGLESMKVKEEDKLDDKYYTRNSEREKEKIDKILETKQIDTKTSKLVEIKRLLDKDEKIIWFKSSTVNFSENGVKLLSKNKKFKNRIKKEIDEIEIKKHENRYVITNKRIAVHSIFNKIFDFSEIPKHVLEVIGEIVFLDLKGLVSFDIEKNDLYDIWFNIEPLNKGVNVFPFEGLTLEEYEKLIDVFTVILPFRAEIPNKTKKLTYIRKIKG